MPGFFPNGLNKFNHQPPNKPEHALHEWTAPIYSRTNPQKATELITSPELDKDGAFRVQSVTGTFLYYDHGVDPTILVALNAIYGQQSKPTTNTNKNSTNQWNISTPTLMQ